MEQSTKEYLAAFMIQIKNRIWKLLGISLCSKKQELLFERIKVGDVVFCKMPVSELERLKIPQGHRDRPYVIVDKKGDYLVGYLCTTHPSKKNSYV